MKRCILILTLIFGFQLTMMAQKPQSKQSAPKEDIKVNRVFDEKGNLVKFDSIYSYSWSGDTLLMDSLQMGNFQDLFGKHFNFSSDSSMLDHPLFQGFDKDFLAPFGKQEDSIMSQFNQNFQFNFNNDSLHADFKGIEEFFKQFSEDKNDSTSVKSPFNNHFNFAPDSMDKMMEMMKQQMKSMEEQYRKHFSK